ncbi:hypothetical protein [Embleya hyalina]|uniref:Uncharacterized protein n=1 Tax=Embleya hyalina TaxID=516124 RepID=A0A401YJT3_9ACTN|nr:hypothetical protein [Embleya hyalina]GCD94865.1 hypothetical protein EHYA_02534 [Embleya hyalina]
MTELPTAAARIVPHVTAAAATMGMQVLASTRERLADGAAHRGRVVGDVHGGYRPGPVQGP